MIFATSGCLKRDELENVTVYTTVYPIEFLTDTLYGDNSKVLSIYPDGVDTNSYNLTDKQVNDYSKAAIFVYNGLTDEKDIARTFINKNKDMRIIDVSYGLKYTYAVEELWLSPNNYLMLATTIKNNLQDFITNKYLKEEIENQYVNVLEDKLSTADAELRGINKNSNGKQYTIVGASRVFKFLTNYGFEVVCLEDEENLTTNNLNAIKAKFKSNEYNYIFVRDDTPQSDLVKELVDSYNAEVVTFKMLTNISDEDRKSGENYFTLMAANMDAIKSATIGK